MFRSQFKVTSKKSLELKNLYILFVTVYIKPWTHAHLAVEAPSEDLNLLISLQHYKFLVETVSKKLIKSCQGISGTCRKNW